MMKRWIAGAAAISVSLLMGISHVEAADNAKGSHPDQKFFKKAAQGGLAEVALGQMAADKAASDEVKRFGQRMVTDHSEANKELQTLATSEGVTLPKEMGSEAKALQKKLSGLSGAAFDKAYMQEMLKDHQKDISAFKKQAEQGKDDQVKDWAAGKVPTLEEHYALAQETYKQVQGNTTSSSLAPGAMGSANRPLENDKNATPGNNRVGAVGSQSK